MDDDDFNPSTLTGLGLDTILADLELPTSSSLGNQLGLSGLNSFASNRIFSGFAEDGAIGVGEGDDWEDEVNQDLEREIDGEDVKMGIVSPPVVQSPGELDMPMGDDEDLFGPEPPRKRQRRDKTKSSKGTAPPKPVDVRELYPSFQPGKVLKFTELFKGRALKKSKIKYRPLNGKSLSLYCDSTPD